MEILPNETLADIVFKELKSLPNLKYTAEETVFALRIQETLAKPIALEKLNDVIDSGGEVTKGSTDVGDVSWVVPTVGFSTTCWIPGTPAHCWQAVAAGGTTFGRKGMLLAAKTLASSAWELIEHPDTIAAAKKEHTSRRANRPYDPLLLPDQPPPLDYRNSPVP
jgi:aminobenzoyl-glutamate utilization protein B